jgi:hypothetical protein
MRRTFAAAVVRTSAIIVIVRPTIVGDEAAQARERKRAADRALQCELVNRSPTLFDPASPNPLKIGIDRDIRAAIGASSAVVGLALAEHVGGAPIRRRWRPRARCATASDDGAPCGKVTAGRRRGSREAGAARRPPAP